MKRIGWNRITTGHYLHLETGIEIVKVAAHRDHGYAVGVRWHLWCPDDATRTLRNKGCERTLRSAIAWAEGEFGFIGNVALARKRIAQAWDEAHRENEGRLCDCDGTHAPVPGGHSVACRLREKLKLFGEPTIEQQHAEALGENYYRTAAAWADPAAAPEREEYTGAHFFRGELGGWCELADCNGRVGSPAHVADRLRIEAAHHSAIMEEQLRTVGPIGMGRR